MMFGEISWTAWSLPDVPKSSSQINQAATCFRNTLTTLQDIQNTLRKNCAISCKLEYSLEQLWCTLNTENLIGNNCAVTLNNGITKRSNCAVLWKPRILPRKKKPCCILNTQNIARNICVVSLTPGLLPGSTSLYPEHPEKYREQLCCILSTPKTARSNLVIS